MDIGWKIFSVGSVLAVNVVMRKVIDQGWKAATGHTPPHDPDEPGVSIWEVVAFAAVSGAVIGLTRQLALRDTAKWYGGPADKRA